MEDGEVIDQQRDLGNILHCARRVAGTGDALAGKIEFRRPARRVEVETFETDTAGNVRPSRATELLPGRHEDVAVITAPDASVVIQWHAAVPLE